MFVLIDSQDKKYLLHFVVTNRCALSGCCLSLTPTGSWIHGALRCTAPDGDIVVLQSICHYICNLTSFLDLLPAELVPPDHWEDWIKAVHQDQIQGLLQVMWMETRGRSLNVTHYIHLCAMKKKKKCYWNAHLAGVKERQFVFCQTAYLSWPCRTLGWFPGR